MSNFNRQMRRAMAARQKKAAPQGTGIDYQLHKAQQLEVLNANVELLKNNVYGQTQVDIVLYALSEGKKLEEAVEFSLEVIDKMNEVNMRRIQQKRAEIEAKMKAENPQVPVDPSQNEGEAAA